MKKQISFDKEVVVQTTHSGFYIKDIGDGDEYVEGKYRFKIYKIIENDIDETQEINISWIDHIPFKDIYEKIKIEGKIIDKYTKKFLGYE